MTPDPAAEAVRWSVALLVAFSEEEAGRGDLADLIAEHAPEADPFLALGGLAYVALTVGSRLAEVTRTTPAAVLHDLTLWAANIPD